MNQATVSVIKPFGLRALLTGLMCLLFAGFGDLAAAQDTNKICKGPRRLVKKLAEDLAKDGLESPHAEAMRVFQMLSPTEKELADLRAKTQKALFKTKDNPKTKRVAKHRQTCVDTALKIAELIDKYPEAETALAEAALALDHSCAVIHKRVGHVEGKDGIWRTPRALELHEKWQSWGRERIAINKRKLEIEEKMAPNWARVAIGQDAKGYEVMGVHVCGKQEPKVLKERLESLVKSLLLVNYFAVGNSKTAGAELHHLCAGTSAKDYEKALKTLEEHKLVTFGDLEYELQYKNGCFFGFGVDRLDKEKDWLGPVLTSAMHDRWKVGIYPNWFSVGLSNYVQLMLTDVEEEVPEGPLSRPKALVQKVDRPVSEMMRNRKLSHFETLTFTPAPNMTPMEVALSTNLVEFILLTCDDPLSFQQKYHEASRQVLEASARPESFDWEQILEKALGRSFQEFEQDWLQWLHSGEGQSMVSTLDRIQ